LSNQSIQFRGPFAFAWVLIALLLPGWLLYSPWLGFTSAQTGVRAWILLFITVELIGVWRNSVHDSKGEPERIRTLSQLLQRIAEVDEAKEKWGAWWKGWSALGTLYVVCCSTGGTWAFWGIGPAVRGFYPIAAAIGVGVFFWLEYHFLRRYRYG
jgi:hypothetical protein